ncbi:MAG: CGNR zinc finger domain-containing protein [Acidobacteria bacterium]|nr:CGNR zinc finger domain-containing protein [Acidobacteriota bacterium]MBA4182711.1 CGNR zinc finger domain-containing protein [Acidobacteriota bacterium]
MKQFKLIGGELSLDFVNTVAERKSNPKAKKSRAYGDAFAFEYLENYADVVAWSRQAKLLTEDEAKRLLEIAKKKSQQAEKIRKRGLALRETLYRLFKSAIEGWEPETLDLEKLNQELAVANKHETINYDRDGFGWKWNVGDESLDYMLWRVAQSAAEILTSGDLTRLRQCGGDHCGWMFLDTSRNRSRQWCDMKDCGNLAKVRRFRQKSDLR